MCMNLCSRFYRGFMYFFFSVFLDAQKVWKTLLHTAEMDIMTDWSSIESSKNSWFKLEIRKVMIDSLRKCLMLLLRFLTESTSTHTPQPHHQPHTTTTPPHHRTITRRTQRHTQRYSDTTPSSRRHSTTSPHHHPTATPALRLLYADLFSRWTQFHREVKAHHSCTYRHQNLSRKDLLWVLTFMSLFRW